MKNKAGFNTQISLYDSILWVSKKTNFAGEQIELGPLNSQKKYNPETARSTGKTSQILREKSVKPTEDDIIYNSSDGIVLYGDLPAFGLKATGFFLLVRFRV